MKKIAKKIKRCFLKPSLSPQAFEAYFYRLPKTLEVKWERDSVDNFIVGWISDGKKEFMTQGKDAKDFIEMVNDAVYTYFDIPEDYVHALSKLRTYNPPTTEMEKLADKSIKERSFRFKRNEELLKAT